MSGWQNQDTIYLIMWRSRKSGATLSELRKTDFGRDRLVETLVNFLGYDRDEIIVIEKDKAWKPEKVGAKNGKKGGASK